MSYSFIHQAWAPTPKIQLFGKLSGNPWLGYRSLEPIFKVESYLQPAIAGAGGERVQCTWVHTDGRKEVNIGCLGLLPAEGS